MTLHKRPYIILPFNYALPRRTTRPWDYVKRDIHRVEPAMEVNRLIQCIYTSLTKKYNTHLLQLALFVTISNHVSIATHLTSAVSPSSSSAPPQAPSGASIGAPLPASGTNSNSGSANSCLRAMHARDPRKNIGTYVARLCPHRRRRPRPR